jgi:hypothetical protein
MRGVKESGEEIAGEVSGFFTVWWSRKVDAGAGECRARPGKWAGAMLRVRSVRCPTSRSQRGTFTPGAFPHSGATAQSTRRERRKRATESRERIE